MIFIETTLPACCGFHPMMDTWDRKESRSVYCARCGRRTESFWRQDDARRAWRKLIKAAEEKQS